MVTKRVICLAASIKHGGFCYAGKDVDSGEWIRPVSDDPGHAINAYYRVVGKDDPAVVGDILSMDLGNPVPQGWQQENWEHVKRHWRRLGKADYSTLSKLVDTPTSVWGLGRSTNHGQHDDLTEAEAAQYGHSLLLVSVNDLRLISSDEGFDQVSIRVRASFSVNNIPYTLRVTDPVFFSMQPGEAHVGDALLCCSLAEAYSWQDGSRHVSKLVAAVITPETLDCT